MINLPIKAYGNKSVESIIVDDLYWFYENGIHTVDFCCYAEGQDEAFYIANSTGYLNTDGYLIYTGDIYHIYGTGDCVAYFDKDEGFSFDPSTNDDMPMDEPRKVCDVIMENDLGEFKGSIYVNQLNSV